MRRGNFFDAGALLAEMREEVRAGLAQARLDVAEAVRREAVQLAPTRSGKLKASIKRVKGRVGSKEPHAGIIDRGRKRGVTKRGEKRTSHKKGKVNKAAPMFGSKQAPKGISRPAVKAVLAKADQIVSAALGKHMKGGE